MDKFVKLTRKNINNRQVDGTPIVINTRYIVIVTSNMIETSAGVVEETFVAMHGQSSIYVRETVDQVNELIEAATR